MDCSQATAAQVDQEVKGILEDAFRDAMDTLRTHRELLDEVSEYLLLKETISGDELMAYVKASEKTEPTQLPESDGEKKPEQLPEEPEAPMA